MSTLTPAEAEAVSASVKSLSKQGPMIATRMYNHFFTDHPDMKPYFSADFLGVDPSADTDQEVTLMAKVMAHVLFQFIVNIESSGGIQADIERVAAKHFTRGIKPEFFPFLGDALMRALSESLGDKATPDTMSGWRKGYDAMAADLIKRQQRIEAEIAQLPNSWKGFTKMQITKYYEAPDPHSSSSSSESDGDDFRRLNLKVHFKRADGLPLPEYKFMQYVCLRIKLPTGISHRNFYISGPGGVADEWIIDFRHEGTGGVLSAFVRRKLGPKSEDKDLDVEMSMPTGAFLLLESLSG